MVDIAVTAADVLLTNGQAHQVTYGATITQGQSLYKDPADSKWKLAQCDGTADEAGATDFGVALSAGANNQTGLIIKDGEYDPGAVPIVGQVYVVSATAGGIAPIEDLVATNKVTILGYGTTAGTIKMLRAATGEAHP